MRVREFTLAEIEHFVDPEDKSHPKFSEVANLKFLMFPREEQMSGQSAKTIPLGEAVAKVWLCNFYAIFLSSLLPCAYVCDNAVVKCQLGNC